MILVDLQTLFGYLTPVSLTIGVIYHIMTLNNTRKTQKHALETRQAQLYMQLYSFYDNKDFLKDNGNVANGAYAFENADDWWEKYSPLVDYEAFSSWLRVGRFFDGVGILIKRDLIEKGLVFELLGDVIRGSWEGYESTWMGRWVESARVYFDRPLLWHNFEHLYHELMKWHEEHPELKT